jgi:hypothetical protein
LATKSGHTSTFCKCGGCSAAAADLIGLIGFPLTVLGLLALNSRETPD